MTGEAWHPFVVGLAQAIAPGSEGQPALLLPAPVLDRALAEVRTFPAAEQELVALHLVGFARVLHQQSGALVRALVEQLVTVAATALSDPMRLRDAFGASSAEGDFAAMVGAATSRLPVTRDTSAPSVLDVRLGRAVGGKSD